MVDLVCDMLMYLCEYLVVFDFGFIGLFGDEVGICVVVESLGVMYCCVGEGDVVIFEYIVFWFLLGVDGVF